jgi:hypothetical protein
MIGVAYHSDLVALAALGAGSCIFSLATMNRFFKAGFTHADRILKQAGPLLVPLALAALLAASQIGGGGLWPLLLRVLAFGAVYLLALWKLRRFAVV